MKQEDVKCPKCGEFGTLQITTKVAASSIGTFSLSGNQMKFSAREVPLLYCDSEWCDFKLLGEWDADGRHATFGGCDE